MASARASLARALRAHTHFTIKKFSTGLAVMENLYGRLPAAVDATRYTAEQWPAYLAAVHEFDWAGCEEMLALPAEAQDLLCKLLARDPEQRPQSATEALQHPWLTGEDSCEADAADEAAAAWAAAHQELDVILDCDDDVLQQVLAAATAPQADAVCGTCGTGSCNSSSSGSSIDASCCRRSSSSTAAMSCH
jgi:serine/threonine protein kinase